MKKLTVVGIMFCFSILAQAQETQIIAHRGAWKNTKSPQNSIAALRDAIAQEVWGAEFDVHLTKDDVLVVNHDNDFQGIDIATSTYNELLAKKHPNGEQISTAEAYLKEGLKQNKTKMIFELKTNRLGVDRTLKSVEIALALVKKLKAVPLTEFIAFSYDACLHFRALDKNIPIHYLNGDKSPQQIKDANLTGIDYHFSVFKNNTDWISTAKTFGLKTNVWTVNTEEDMHYFIDKGIDYITTDEPEKLHSLIKK
ncbi:glycerophosphodiester phosphodiesterase [Sphingobacterium alkalisoli]|uniref:Glycerophosphodiester phosphodiesterase n=1 Tax=Sphingobacterium alkalisoli TaxID=1874115 RepID=A0A4U0GZB8_9SPHI|nr:glycerophosphodiester phosphodiesterase family protein [Sphingobacterium alkalisoli]TJY64446.1 glycerophosphodiester phosphodiesterase [Sphingobacterium alkalisoli]GGH21712.1 glycerophosphoryl diester phosphodiesterase [Sphingobacterium alkalisoli]